MISPLGFCPARKGTSFLSPDPFPTLWFQEAVQEFGDSLNKDATGKVRMVHERAEVLDIPCEEMGCLAVGGNFENRAVLLWKKNRAVSP